MTLNILHVDSSARYDGSVTRELTANIVEKFTGAEILSRDLANPLPHIDAGWIGANFTAQNERSTDQQNRLALSDSLVAELQKSDVVVIGAPIYNFSIPAGLKAWIDQIARAGVTFSYTENGPQGLLSGKRAIVVVASGGVPVDSDADFATPYLRQLLNFIGITDITIIAAEQAGISPDALMDKARGDINALNLGQTSQDI